MTDVSGGLKGKEKKKIFRVKEKVRLLSEEKKQREQRGKKLSFRLNKLQRDYDILQAKIGDKSGEKDDLQKEREKLSTLISENNQGIKKFLAILTLKSKDIEVENKEASRRIHHIDILIEKTDHFLDKNSRKEEKLSRDIEAIKRDLELLNNEILGLHKDISETQKELDDKNTA